MTALANAIDRASFLRKVLLLDAVVSGATGLLMMLGAELLQAWLTLPAPLMRYAGLSLLPYAAFVGYLATRDTPPRPIVWAVVVCNALYAADCVLLVLTGLVQPTLLGQAFLLVQAVTVALFAELQVVGLRRAVPATAGASIA